MEYAKVAEEMAQYAGAKLMQRVKRFEQRMDQHARDLEFEEAARLCDEIPRLREFGARDATEQSGVKSAAQPNPKPRAARVFTTIH